MKKRFFSSLKLWVLLLGCVWVLGASGQAAERHALVVGNGDYQKARRLPNAPNDARDVAAELKKAGWQVTLVTDAGIRDMLRALRKFCEQAKGGEAAMFFYAGHGIEVKGKNYLLPVDADLDEDDAEDALPLETLSLDKILGDMAAARIRLKTVVLDCCRDNPLSRSWMASRSSGGGLAEVKESQLPEGAMLVYSTAPGRTAADGRSRNSPFTTALLKRMQAGGGGISDIFGDVATALGKEQQAWIRFDGSGVSFTAFRDYPMIPGNSPTGRPMVMPRPARKTAGQLASERLRSVSKESPYVNSLGMEFVPVPGKPGVLMCRTETRVRDFRAFAEATDYVQSGGAFVLKVKKNDDGGLSTAWELDKDASWEKPGFEQSEDHPVVCVSWDEAQAFCKWLTQRNPGYSYRLPSDGEWSAAVGSLGKYPWGNEWPAPKGAGNYAGPERWKGSPGTGWPTAYEHDDGAGRTARVGGYKMNRFGFYDLGGNVWEWCEDWYRDELNDSDVVADLKKLGFDDNGGRTYRVLRGDSWSDDLGFYLRSSYRYYEHPASRLDNYGFRLVVLAGAGG